MSSTIGRKITVMTILYIPVIRMLTILIKEVYTNVLVAPYLLLPLLPLEPSCTQGKIELEETRNLSRTQQSALELV